MNEARKPTQFLKVLYRLILSSISGIDGYSMGMTSARNYISELEREYLGEKISRKWEKTADDSGMYLRYEVANVEQLRKVIEVYKAKGGELSAVEERRAYSRFE